MERSILENGCFTAGVTNVVPVGTRPSASNQVGRPRACSKNSISMINDFTLTHINTKIFEGKLSKIFISEVCIKPVALRIKSGHRK